MKYLSCDTRPHLLPALEISFGSSIEMVIVSRLPVERKNVLLLEKEEKTRCLQLKWRPLVGEREREAKRDGGTGEEEEIVIYNQIAHSLALACQ